MTRLRTLIVATTLLCAAPALAEVFVLTGSKGEFVSFTNAPRVAAGNQLRFWESTIKLPHRDYLNTGGDANGDHAPAAVVIPAGQLLVHPTPVVVWSHVEGLSNDLVFSIWREGLGWTSPVAVNQRNIVPDYGVKLVLDPDGNVHAVWATATAIPSIWYSKFQAGVWTIAERVSVKEEDSRAPSFTLVCSKLFISYEIWANPPVVIYSFLKEDFD